MKLKKLMHDFLQDYLDQNKIEFSEWSVNVNNQEGFGDYSSNIALKLAKILKKAPIEIAYNIAIHSNASANVFTLSASQPGFVNFHISNDYYLKILEQVINAPENFGKKNKLNKLSISYFENKDAEDEFTQISELNSISKENGFYSLLSKLELINKHIEKNEFDKSIELYNEIL